MRLSLVVVFAVSTVAAAVVSGVAWRRRHRAPAIGTAAVAAGAVSGWAFGATALVLSGTEDQAYLATTTIIVFGSSTQAAFFCLCLAWVDRAWRATPKLVLLLAIEPAMALTAVATNHWHHQFFAGFGPGLQGSVVPVFGPLFWAHCIYGYVLYVAGLSLPVRAWRTAGAGRRWIFGLLPAAVIPPTVTNLIGMSLAGRSVDLTAVGFTFTVVAVYVMLVRQVPELVPVARRHVIDMISDAVAVVDRSGRLVDANPAGQRLLHRLYPDLPLEPLGTMLGPLPGGSVTLPTAGDADQLVADVGGLGADFHVRISPIVDGRGRPAGWVLVARDVTEVHRGRRRLEEANGALRDQLRIIERLRAELAEQATRDPLTGLHNRRYLLEALTGEVARATRDGSPLSVAMVDVDHFKEINDTHGHGHGDAVLVALAQLFSDDVRAGDIVARYGGEEFVIVLPGTGSDQARRRLDGLRRRVEALPVPVDGQALTVTFSAGVASLDEAGVVHRAGAGRAGTGRAGAGMDSGFPAGADGTGAGGIGAGGVAADGNGAGGAVAGGTEAGRAVAEVGNGAGGNGADGAVVGGIGIGGNGAGRPETIDLRAGAAHRGEGRGPLDPLDPLGGLGDPGGDPAGDPGGLLAAADAALYEAKRRGRNRVETSAPVPTIPVPVARRR